MFLFLEQGNGMQKKFSSKNAIIDSGDKEDQKGQNAVRYDIGAPTVKDLLESDSWDCIIMNDYTQAPARLSSREETIEILKEKYAPLLANCTNSHGEGSQCILMQTAAYRHNYIKGTSDIGDFDTFTTKLLEGYTAYANVLKEEMKTLKPPKIAPFGMAYSIVHEENESLFPKLYQNDDFHPTPHGTFLQGCIFHITIFGEAPNLELLNLKDDKSIENLWANARCMQSDDEEPKPFPTLEEAKYLLDVSKRACSLPAVVDANQKLMAAL